MHLRTIPESNTKYALISFDPKGQERHDDPDCSMSELILELVASGEFSNVFWFSHGWMGDVPEAIRQYDLWIGAFDALRATRNVPDFKPLYVGIHWPSRPWGDENLRGTSFAASQSISLDDLTAGYLDRLGETPGTQAAVRTILDEARKHAAADTLSSRAREALLLLDAELGLTAGPDADGIPFDPDAMFEDAEAASFGGIGDGLMDVLRRMSYWSMKKRARKIGENALHPFLNRLQQATAGPATPIHLMGHSFGCVVISAAIGGPAAAAPLVRPIDSVALVQGAVSLWSYASAAPGNVPGYFHPVIRDNKIRGPLVVTRSRHDKAVNKPYEMASRVSNQVSFVPADYPKFGAIGRFGLQGLPESRCVDAPMLTACESYNFECGKIYNLESSKFICKMDGFSGAHNDIGGPEVANAIWEAAFASIRQR